MNKNTLKIVAVLLTHNRKELLQKGLDGLFCQTRPVDQIIIVDSLSTDGTYELLLDKGILGRSNVKYVRLLENKGPSGGFAEGIKLAQHESADWIWILDDDIVPDKECLSTLLLYKDISHCIAPNRDDKTVPFFNPAIGITSHRKKLSFNGYKDYVFGNTCCFEGMLMNAALIDKAGLPDERFFQVYGDTVYGFVISLYTNIVHVKGAMVNRLLPVKKPISSRRVYLLVRNHFLVREYLQKNEILHPVLFDLIFALMILYYFFIMPFKARAVSMPFAVIKGLFHGFIGKFGAPK